MKVKWTRGKINGILGGIQAINRGQKVVDVNGKPVLLSLHLPLKLAYGLNKSFVAMEGVIENMRSFNEKTLANYNTELRKLKTDFEALPEEKKKNKDINKDYFDKLTGLKEKNKNAFAMIEQYEKEEVVVDIHKVKLSDIPQDTQVASGEAMRMIMPLIEE